MAMLAVTAGAATVAVLRGTTPVLVGVGIALYLLALDAVEPLSQEIDHPDRTDGVPRPRGWLLVHLLAAPAVALIPFAVIGAVTVAAFEPDAAVFAAALCVPITLAGACGAVVSVVRDAPDPLSPPVASSAAVPPEFAGFTTTLRLLWPLAISTLAGLGVLAGARAADRRDGRAHRRRRGADRGGDGGLGAPSRRVAREDPRLPAEGRA